MSVVKIIFREVEGRYRKVIVPVKTMEEYLNERNAPQHVSRFHAVRNGNDEEKKRLIQFNYTIYPPEEETPLRGYRIPSDTFCLDIDCASKEESDRYVRTIIDTFDLSVVMMVERTAHYGLHAVFKREYGKTILESQVRYARLIGCEMDTNAKDLQRVWYASTNEEDELIYINPSLFELSWDREKAEAEADKPKSDAAEVVCHDIAHLRASNPDCIGWLSIPDTCISYPVMLTPDEPQRYLHRDFYGSYSYAGVPFLDYHCTTENHNLIIYGHRMKNNTMFGHLEYFQDADFVANHKYILFDTLYKPGTYEIFATYLSQIYDDNDTEHFKYYDFIDCDTQEQLDEYLNFVRSSADYLDESCLPDLDDEVITLSTCNYHVTNGRLVVAARRINEDPGFNQADYGEITVDESEQ